MVCARNAHDPDPTCCAHCLGYWRRTYATGLDMRPVIPLCAPFGGRACGVTLRYAGGRLGSLTAGGAWVSERAPAFSDAALWLGLAYDTLIGRVMPQWVKDVIVEAVDAGFAGHHETSPERLARGIAAVRRFLQVPGVEHIETLRQLGDDVAVERLLELAYPREVRP